MSAWVSTDRRAAGFTVVELLVVLTLLAVIGAIVAVSMSRGLQADAQARSRIEAFEDMQVAMERMTREIRGASPVRAGEAVLEEADAETLQFLVRRAGSECLRFRYGVNDDGDTLLAAQQRSDDDCAEGTFGAWSEQLLVRDLEPGRPPFTFYRDDDREEALDPGTMRLADVAFVEITFQRTLVLDQRPVTVSTVVGLRNRDSVKELG